MDSRHMGSIHNGWLTERQRNSSAGTFWEEKKKSFTFSHNGSAVLTKDWGKNSEPCDSFFTSFFPLIVLSFPVCALKAFIFLIHSGLFIVTSCLLSLLSLLQDLELKLGPAWLEKEKRGGGSSWENSCWTEQIAPLQSVFYSLGPLFAGPPSCSVVHWGLCCFDSLSIIHRLYVSSGQGLVKNVRVGLN